MVRVTCGAETDPTNAGKSFFMQPFWWWCSAAWSRRSRHFPLLGVRIKRKIYYRERARAPPPRPSRKRTLGRDEKRRKWLVWLDRPSSRVRHIVENPRRRKGLVKIG